MKKILILVLSSKNTQHYSDLLKIQKSTWDSKKVDGVETIFYYCDDNIDKTKIADKDLIIKEKESMSNLTLKMKLALEFVLQLEWDYIFKTNASTYVDKEKILKMAQNISKNNCYTGVVGNHEGVAFVSGAGTFLSRDCVKILINNLCNDKYIYFIDDIATAKALGDNFIYPSQEAASRYDYDYNISFEKNIENIKIKNFPYQLRLKKEYGDRKEEITIFEKMFKYLNESYR